MRLGVKAVLEPEENVEVVGETKEVEEALRLTDYLNPDLLIIELRLKEQEDGISLCRRVKRRIDPPYILVYTDNSSKEKAHAVLFSGADSYVNKQEEPIRLRETVKETCAGKKVWLLGGKDREMASGLAITVETDLLTHREKEIYELLLKRYSNFQISEELAISISTVKTHIGHIFEKLELSSRKEIFRDDHSL